MKLRTAERRAVGLCGRVGRLATMSAAQTTSVMVFGALMAVAGVVLIFYAKSPGSNRIRAFTVEFELSTPALVVFLAGCGLMLSPFLLEQSIAVDPTGSPADVDDEDSTDSGESSTGEVDDAIEPLGTATEMCGGGQRFRFEILTTTEADGILRVPLRLSNLSEDEKGFTFSGGLSATDQVGRQLDLVNNEWKPPYLDPLAHYEGYMELRSDSQLKSITVRYRPNGSCPIIAVEAAL
jgi:hypothetical protein